ncbi:4763_t:CDS:1, partial [Scutellospora calospora]
ALDEIKIDNQLGEMYSVRKATEYLWLKSLFLDQHTTPLTTGIIQEGSDITFK